MSVERRIQLWSIEMVRTLIFPAAIRYQKELAATSLANLKAVGIRTRSPRHSKRSPTSIVKSVQDSNAELESASELKKTASDDYRGC